MQIMPYLALIGMISQLAFAQAPSSVLDINSDENIEISELGDAPDININAKENYLIADKNFGKSVIVNVVVTAYSSTHDQTDDMPFITASGSRVRDGIVACNFLPFGTKITLPKLFGDKIFVVEDRMAKRFSDRIDIWFPSRWQATQFGLKILEMKIL